MSEVVADRIPEDALSEKAVAFLDRIGAILLHVIVIAAPWEIFQRIPMAGVTLVKLAGAMLIAVAAARVVVTRSWAIPRTGLEFPIAAFAVICALCTWHSLDRGASWEQLRIYLTYAALFYAAVLTVRDIRTVESLILALTLSSAVVSAVALLCSAGLLTPSLSYVTEHVSRRVLPGARHEAPLRIVATSDDFNQGVFIPLMAFALSLFTFGWRRMGVLRRIGLYALLALLLGAMLVAVSRSSVAIAICLLVVYVTGHFRSRLRLWPVIAAIVLVAALGGALGHRYLTAFVTRTSSISSHDPSVEGRRYGYSVAWHALPQYWLAGAGLNTSDVILSRAEHPEILRGQTLHSVPFKILLETGVFGLAAYLGLIAAFAAILWRRAICASSGAEQRLGAAFLAWLFACFLVTCVQPLTVVSMFPVMVGLALGPLAHARAGSALCDAVSRGPRTDAWLATLAVGVIVAPNAIQYQMDAPRVAQFVDYLEEGAGHERRAEWSAAEEAYRSAATVAEPQSDGNQSTWRRSIDAAPYFANAATAFGLDYVYRRMALGQTEPQPRAACEFALGRAIMAQGRLAEAVEHLDGALNYAPEYAYAWFTKGECLWALGEFKSAVDAYAKAAAVKSAGGKGAYAARLNAMALRIEEIGQQNPPSPEALLEAARLWRIQGAWDKALALYQTVAASSPSEADARFHLGVDAEIRGRADQAIAEYETALRLLPNHYESALRLQRLRSSQAKHE
ncbi:MAG: tetratricopeptide repeat protein [Candidatus Hydrogenedentes bacterium]|nr:tetratricopeptide repeat protein [Candidatus Hydrogenedentota bacterium]